MTDLGIRLFDNDQIFKVFDMSGGKALPFYLNSLLRLDS